MGRGHRWMYYLTGLPGWMIGRGSAWPGSGCWHGIGPRYGAMWAGAGPYWPGPWGAAPTAGDEAAFLKEEAEALRNYLEGIERRISELEKTSE